MKINPVKVLMITVVAVGLGSTATAALAGDNRTRLECRDELALEDASARARYEKEKGRVKFSVEVEAAPGGSFRAGDILQVRVSGELVGTVRLSRAGDLVGELNFDTTAGPDDMDSPFPANFPPVGRGTIVTFGARFGCDLQSR